MGRLIRYVVLVLLVIGGGVGAWRWRASSSAPAVKYDTGQAGRGKLTARVPATGTLSALVTVQVGAQVSGRISKLYADYNSRVTRGQTIAVLDPALFGAAVELARANRVAADGSLV